MKEYMSPVIIDNDELAEGIFATGGSGINYDDDPNCWTVSVIKDQVVAHEGWATFRVRANHPNTVQHISSSSSVTIVFNAPITSAVFEGFEVDISGNMIKTTRVQHGNSYMSADQYDSLLKVYTADPAALTVIGQPIITCKHEVNVQGQFD